MDRRLRKLQREAKSNNDVESWQRYAHALERVLAGEELEPEYECVLGFLECPTEICGADLTVDGAVAIEVSVAGLNVGGGLLTCVDTGGKVMDVDDVIAKGLLSAVSCTDCWEQLDG